MVVGSRNLRLRDEFVEFYEHEERHGRNPLIQSFGGMGYAVYKRTYARPTVEGVTEEWYETVRRVVDGAQAIGAGYTMAEMERLFYYMWHRIGLAGGRMLWQLGTENNQTLGGDSLVNCWYTELSNVDDFIWMFDRLMLGGGVGFSVDNAQSIGVVGEGCVEVQDGFDVDFVVPDNREGWGELLRRTLDAHLLGRSFTYSVDAIRPEGSPIKTFGGVASGSGALVKGVEDIQDVLRGAKGGSLSSVDVLDIANIIGAIVVSGNVRRSAQIAIGSSSDDEFMHAKRWDLGHIPNHRAMSNNSVDVQDFADIPESFWEGYMGNGEAYGLVNVSAARKFGRTAEPRFDSSIVGFNPCAEIPLADRESCNLSELVLPNISTLKEAKDVAGLLYKMQKAVAAMPYLDARSDDITNANMRLGMGVTGVAQASNEQKGWLDAIYTHLRDLDGVWSAVLGLPESVRLTTVKPSGTLSLLAGVTAGGHPGFSQYHIRRVRMSANDPVFEWCQNQGYKWEWQRMFDGTEDTKTGIVEFPVELPTHTVFADDVSAIEQLEMQAFLQAVWADNAVSVTVYMKPEELTGIRAYLADRWHKIKSVSFLLKNDHGFDQAPMEAIDAETFAQRIADITWNEKKIKAGVSDLLDSDCGGGQCPIR